MIAMKRFRIGIAAIVAIVAMSFTVATHGKSDGKHLSSSKQVYVCVQDVDAFGLFDCTTNTQVQPNMPCSLVKQMVRPGDCVLNLQPAVGQRVCPGGQLFCCAQLKPRGSCPNCKGGPGQVVIAIWCYQ